MSCVFKEEREANEKKYGKLSPVFYDLLVNWYDNSKYGVLLIKNKLYT